MEKANDSRIKRTSQNMLFSIILYVLRSLLSFVSRTIFIYYLSTEYLGLNSLFSNILTLLSLAELGFGNAIIFSMYKPIAENDDEKVRQLLALYKKFYRVVGIVILIIGLAITPFLNFLIKDVPDVFVNLYIVYLIFLTNTVFSYFLSYRRALLITNQRQDIESKISIISVVLLHVFQIVALILFQNYYIYIILITLFTVVENVIVYFVTNKIYPEYIKKPQHNLDKAEQKVITKNVFALFFHKLEYVLVCSTDNIIISAFLGINILGVYSNYAMIISYITILVGFFTSAVRGSMGNYISLKEPHETENLFNKLNFSFMWFVGWCSICLICLFQPFINVWLNEQYLLSIDIVLLLVFSFYFTRSRDLLGITKECAGIFWQDRFKAIFTAIINIVASIVLCHFIGLSGVVLGTILSIVLVPLWLEPYYVHKIYFKSSVKNYFKKYLLYFLTAIVLGLITYILCAIIPVSGVLGLIIKLAICVIVPNALFALLYHRTENFKYLINVAKNLLKKKKAS